MMLGGGERVIKGGGYPYYSRFFNRFWYGLAEGDDAQTAIMDAYTITTLLVRQNFRTRGSTYFQGIKLVTNP